VSAYDVAIVGGGPNGLTAAAYLARAGARVMVLERRFELGGTMTSDDYSTPHLYNIGQFALPLGEELPPFTDLDLAGEAVRFIEPDAVVRLSGLTIRRGGAGLGKPVEEMFAAIRQAVVPLLYRPPAPIEARGGLTPDALAAQASDSRAATILRYACARAGFVDGSEPLGPIGAFTVAAQFSPALVAGGTKSLVNGLYRSAVAAGADVRLVAEVTSVNPVADGFTLRCSDGREFAARTAISTLDPQTTFGGLIKAELPAELVETAATWRFDRHGSFIAHYGIKGRPPGIAGDAEEPPPLSVLLGFAGEDDVIEHVEAVGAGRLPARPAGALSVTTAHDPLQASRGPYGPLHTLRYETLAPSVHPWERERRTYRESCWNMIGAGDETRLLFEFADSPRDLERRFRTARGGALRQGRLTPSQTLVNRPHESCSTGRTSVEGFYIGGGGVHPGVPGTLAPGYNVARVVCEDLGLDPVARR
jgi:phytoene dehydrogenase-like protein